MAKKNKDPAFLFYPADFLIGTYTMSFEDRGKYITILCIMHQQGRLSEKAIKTIIGEFSNGLKEKFIKDNKGLWYNERLNEEMEKRSKYTKGRIKNLGAHMGNHIENRNININISIRRTLFTKDVFVFSDKYPTELLNEFNSYWIEMNKSKTKMRYELQQTFEISRRLATWARNDKGYNKIEKTSEPITYKELLRRFNSGETDIWEQYERETINGSIKWTKRKPIE